MTEKQRLENDRIKTARWRRKNHQRALESVRRYHKKNPEIVFWAQLIGSARVKKIPVRLPRHILVRMARRGCHYCGMMNRKGINGIDRKNNALGYIAGNCVACCWPCNYAKGARYTYKEFKAVRRPR